MGNSKKNLKKSKVELQRQLKRLKSQKRRRMRKHVQKKKRPLFYSDMDSNQPDMGQSLTISNNINLIRFLCLEANPAQREEVFFEIDPPQLAAVREIISNVSRQDKHLAENFWEETSVQTQKRAPKQLNALGKRKARSKAFNAVEKIRNFVGMLLDQKATRPMLRKNAALMSSLLHKGLKMYESRAGITCASDSKKRSSELQENVDRGKSKKARTSKHNAYAESSEQSSEDERSELEDGEVDFSSEEEEDENVDKPDEEGEEEDWFGLGVGDKTTQSWPPRQQSDGDKTEREEEDEEKQEELNAFEENGSEEEEDEDGEE